MIRETSPSRRCAALLTRVALAAIVISTPSIVRAQTDPSGSTVAFESAMAWVSAWSAAPCSEVRWRIQNSILDARGGGVTHSFVTIEHTMYRWPDRFVRRSVVAPGEELPRDLTSGLVPYIGTEAILSDGRRVRLAADGNGYESLGVRSLRDAALDHIGRSPFIVAHLAASVPPEGWVVTSGGVADGEVTSVLLPSIRVRFDLTAGAASAELPVLTSVARLRRDNTVLLEWSFDEPRTLVGLPGPVGTKRRLIHAGEGGSSQGLPAALMELHLDRDLADSVFDVDLGDATFVHPVSGDAFDGSGGHIGSVALPGRKGGWVLTASLAAIGTVVACTGAWIWWKLSRGASGG